jgi:hypothetical protein
MTSKNKRHNKRSRTSRKMKKNRGKNTGRGRDNRYYTEVGDSDRDSVDARMEETFTNMNIQNRHKYDNQYGWLAVGVVGVIGVILLGGVVIRSR